MLLKDKIINVERKLNIFRCSKLPVTNGSSKKRKQMIENNYQRNNARIFQTTEECHYRFKRSNEGLSQEMKKMERPTHSHVMLKFRNAEDINII